MQAELLRVVRPKTLTIPEGSTNSPSYTIEDVSFGSVQMPSAMTGATWNIQVSNDGTNFKDCPDVLTQDGNNKQPSYTFAANECVTIWDEVFAFRYMRLVSASSEAADREFNVVVKG